MLRWRMSRLGIPQSDGQGLTAEPLQENLKTRVLNLREILRCPSRFPTNDLRRA